MSFFKEFKEDLSQAVNELMPGEEQEGLKKEEDILVNTFDDEIDLESELSKLDGLLEKVSQETEKETDQGKKHSDSLFHKEDEVNDSLFFQNEKTENLFLDKTKGNNKTEKDKTENVSPQKNGFIQEKKEFVKKVEQKDTKDEVKEVQKQDKEVQKEEIKSEIKQENQKEKEVQKEKDSQKDVKASFDFANTKKQKNDTINPIKNTSADITSSSDLKDDKKTSNNQKFDKKEQITEEEIQMNGTGETKDLLGNDKVTLEEGKQEIEEGATHPQATDETAIITTGTSLKGNINSNGSIDLQGEIEGDIQCNGKLVVTGTIKGNSNSAEFFADAAKIEGEVVSTGTVKIGLGSVVIGNVKATSAVIAGAIKGDIDVKGPVVVDTSAVVMGNIKSRSVQINNGAVIEGFCSQSYAEINMESLFGEKKGKK